MGGARLTFSGLSAQRLRAGEEYYNGLVSFAKPELWNFARNNITLRSARALLLTSPIRHPEKNS